MSLPKPLPIAALLLAFGLVFADVGATVSGVVQDMSGAVVPRATVTLLNPQQTILGTTSADPQGRFTFARIAPGSYVLLISSRGFAERRLLVDLRQSSLEQVIAVLEFEPIQELVTVTAYPGSAEATDAAVQPVNVVERDDIRQRARAVLAQAAAEEVGVHLQRTSPTIAGIYVRGLTGNKVNVFVDGIRYSNSAQRGGINTFLDLIEPSNLQAMEILRGPNSAQYGSDAIGGSVQFLSRIPSFSADGRPSLHGTMDTSFSSADAGFGSTLSSTYSRRNYGLLVNLGGRRVNTLRPGAGLDSHNAITRFLGLRSKLLFGDRLPDTAFTQYGGMMKMNWAPTADSQVILNYTRSQQDGGRRYDQLIGGDGNLVAELRNLMLDLAYIRYDRFRLGWLDQFTVSYSYNAQREERVNQGGNGNPRATINHEYEHTNVNGFQVQAAKQWLRRSSLLAGGDFYHERIHSPSFGVNPTTNTAALRRPRIPDHAGYNSVGAYLQDIFEIVPAKLRLVGNLRYAAASYRVSAADSPIVSGKRLWPDDTLHVRSVTFRGGVLATPLAGFSFFGNVSRGFRAPHMTDLGTLGLTGSGFEVAAPDVQGRGATVGTTASVGAVSTGLPVEQVGPETSLNYEVGARYRTKRVATEFSFFVNDIKNAISKQALILPPGAVGQDLAGEKITAQSPTGVVFVAASSSPVLVRANYGDARIRGLEHTLDCVMSSNVSFSTIFTFLRSWDPLTGLPPNIEGGTPAPDGYLKIRYSPASHRLWLEPYIHVAARQSRLSSLDLEDRRTGAMRTRSSIRSFFYNGATARGLVGPGADGTFGTADDRLLATAETLAQVQDRVLGPGVQQGPLFLAVPGYVTFNLRSGIRLGERHDLLVDIENLGDRNYRGVSWGLDAPGRGISIRYRMTW